MTTLFPDNVRFERESRWSIDLGVTPVATSKRRTSGQDTIPRTFEIKRRCYDWEDGYDNSISNNTHASSSSSSSGGMSKEMESHGPAWHRPDKQRWSDHACRQDTNETHRVGGDVNAARPTATPSHSRLGMPTLPASHPLAPRDTETHTAAVHPQLAVDRSHQDTLQQQQIMRNYQEFAGRTLLKEAGLLSPISDGERKVFERIFLGDGEVSSPLTDDSVMDFDSTMGEE